jgi:hypothetical protein
VPLPSFYIQGDIDYKEGNYISYDMIPIKALFLLVYFTYISIYIAIYIMGNTLKPSGVFWKMGQVLVCVTYISIDIAIYILGNTLKPSGVFWKMGRVLVCVGGGGGLLGPPESMRLGTRGTNPGHSQNSSHVHKNLQHVAF